MAADDLTARDLAYYEAIGPELTDAEFACAVRDAIRECTFFPTAAELLAFGRSARREIDAATPPHRRTLEEREEAQRLAASGLALIRAAVAKRPELPPPPSHARRALPVGTMSAEVELTDERRAQLAERNQEALARHGASK